MKKIWLAILVGIFCGSFLFAVDNSIWLSSNTNVAITNNNLCPGITYVVNGSTYTSGNHGVFHGVCINDATTGNVTVYNSSASANNPIAVIRSTSAIQGGCRYYDVFVSSGLTYTNSQSGTDMTILYNCY